MSVFKSNFAAIIKQISLFIMIGLVTNPVQAAEEVSVNRLYFAETNSQLLAIKDAKYSFMLANPTWPTMFNDEQVLDKITLGIDHRRITTATSTIPVNVTFDVTATKWNGSAFVQEVYKNITLSVQYSPAMDYSSEDVFLFKGGYQYTIEITATQGIDQNEAIYLEAGVHTTRYYSYDITYTPPSDSITRAFTDKQLAISWPYVRGAEAYDLEWCFVDTFNNVLPTTNINYSFTQNTSRVRVSNNAYEMPVLYQSGVLLFRYRPVYYDFATQTPYVEGNWSMATSGQLSVPLSLGQGNRKPYLGVDRNFNKTFNWAAATAFVEEGKTVHTLVLTDGLGRERQSQVSNREEKQVMVAEPIFDGYGRPSVAVLPSPVPRYGFQYIDSIHVPADLSYAHYNYTHFDLQNMIGSSQGPGLCEYNYVKMSDVASNGAAHYFSDKNTYKEGAQAFVPDANQVPFMITQYMPDGSGRPKKVAGGFGEEFQPFTDHAMEFMYTTGSGVTLQNYFQDVNHGSSGNYRKQSVKDQNGQETTTYHDAQDRVVISMLTGGTPYNLEPVDGSTGLSTITEDLTQKNQNNNGVLVATYDDFIQPGESFIVNYNVDIPQYSYLCDNSTQICFDCIYDVELVVTKEEACTNNQLDTLYIGKVTAGQFVTSNNSCSQNTVYSLNGGNPITIAPVIAIASYIRINKTISPNDSAMEAAVDFYMDQSGCIEDLADAFTRNLRNFDLENCNRTPCELRCENQLGSFTSYLINYHRDETTVYTTTYDTAAALADYNATNGTSYDETNPIFLAWFDKEKDRYATTTSTIVVSYDTTAATTAYNAATQACLNECAAGIISAKTKCERLEEELIAAFLPGELYADYDPMSSYDGISTYSIFSATNDFNNFVYTNSAIDYRQADGTPYPSNAAGPWSLSKANFITQFEPQWATAIYNYLKANGDLPDEAVCYLSTCSTYASTFEYDAILQHTPTYEQAAEARISTTQNNHLLQPSTVFGASGYTFSQTPNHFTQAFTDPALSIAVVGDSLLDYLNGNNYTQGADLYTLTYAIARDASANSSSPTTIGQSDCYKDREWQVFRSLYLQERNRLIDKFLYSCTPTDNIPFIWHDVMDANPQAVDLTTLNNADSAQLHYDTAFEASCESSCDWLADKWIQTLDSCNNADTNTLNDLKADFVKLCKASCNGYSLTGYTSLPATPDTVYAGSVPVDTVPSAITITQPSPCSGTIQVSSFAEIIDTYENCGAITYDINCNPYSLAAEPYQSELTLPTLDECGCDKITHTRQEYDSKRTAGTLPPGITFVDEYFTYLYDITLTSFTELECECTASSGMGSVNVVVPEGMGCNVCTDCDVLLADYQDFYNAMYGTTAYTFGGDTTEVLFDLFSNYLKADPTKAHQFEGGILSSLLKECQNLKDVVPNSYNLSPVAADLMEFIGAVYEETELVNGSTYDLPLYHSYYTSSLYPHAFDTNAVVQVSIVGNTTSTEIRLLATGGLAVTDTISINAIAPISNTFADIFQLTSIAADFPAVTDTGEVYHFNIGAIGIGTGLLNLTGESTFPIYKRITNVGVSSLTAAVCENRYANVKTADPCVTLAVNEALLAAQNEQTINLDLARYEFTEAYKAQCELFTETYTLEYDDNDYQATLYYYTQDGNLIQTVAPNGVSKGTPANHTFKTQYHYNAINQLVGSDSPDGGRTKNWYNQKGQLVLSQNAEQRVIKGTSPNTYAEYSYTLYDELGRIVEVGELQAEVDYNGQIVANPTLEDLPADIQDSIINHVPHTTDLTLNLGGTPVQVWDVKAFKQATYTYYSEDLSANVANYFGGQNRYLVGRVGSTTIEEEPDGDPTTYDYAIHFAYDIHGNVATIINENTALRSIGQHLKTIQYEYDLLSGDVKEVLYQANQPDAKYHRYRYDANNRLASVQTSSDHLIWEEDARYEYYLHGPLARTELGEQKVQGLDYVYNLQGWIKAMNSNSLQEANDPGKDGLAGNSYYSSRPDLHEQIARDVFGYVVDYYEGDYTAIDGTKQTFAATHGGTYAYGTGGQLVAQYNGNIAGYAPGITNVHNEVLDAYGRTYKYDQLYRLKLQQAHTVAGQLAGNTWAGATASNRYKTELTFDANGNITDLVRNGSGAGTAAMDDLHYDYNNAGTNQLTNVTDAVGVAQNSDFGAYQQLTSDPSASYTYNPMGQLISDSENEIANIEWHLNGKVAKITRTVSSQQPDLEFQYDPFGNRILKIVKPTTNIGDWKFTHYANDASGKHMAVYENNLVAEGSYATFILPFFECEGQDQAYTLNYYDDHISGGVQNGFAQCGRDYNFPDIIAQYLRDAGFTVERPTDNTFTLYRTDEHGWSNPTLELTLGSTSMTIHLTIQSLYELSHELAEHALYGSERVGIDQQVQPLSNSTVAFPNGATNLAAASAQKHIIYLNGSELNLTLMGSGTVGLNDFTIRRTSGAIVGQVTNLSGSLATVAANLESQFTSGTFSAQLVSGQANTVQFFALQPTATAENYYLEFSTTGDLWLQATRPDQVVQFNHTNHRMGLSNYELSNYLGNVSNTISNRALYGASGVVYEEDFSTNVFNGITDWSLSGGASSANGYARNIGTNAFMRKPLTVTSGQGYVVQFDLTTMGSYTVVNITDGNGSLGSYQLTSGTHMLPFTPTTTAVTIEWANDATVSQEYQVDNILVQPNGRDLILAEVMQYQDYYPYGMTMPGRQGSSGKSSRYGFNGMEQTDEIAGSGNSLDFKARMYDSRLGRFLSLDPAASEYPSLSDYAYVANNPIFFIDPDGRIIRIHYQDKNGNNKHYDYKSEAKLPDNEFVQQTVSTLDALQTKGADVVGIIPALSSDDKIVDLGMSQLGEREQTIGSSNPKWNPNNAYESADGERQSPAMGLLHELAHVYIDWYPKESIERVKPVLEDYVSPDMDAETQAANAKKYFEDLLEYEKWKATDSQYGDKEHRFIIEEVENPAAEALGEDKRSNNKFGRNFESKGPFSTEEKNE